MFHLKNSSKLRLLGLSALVLCSAVTQAQVTKSGAGYLLRVKYVRGVKLKYSTITSVVSMGRSASALKFSTPVLMDVKDVLKSRARISLTVGPVTMNGSVLQQAETHDVFVDTRNSADSSLPMVASQLPDKPVKVGETWSTMAPIPDPSGASHTMRVTYKFQGLKTVGGRSLAMIGYTLTGGASGTGTLAVLAGDGTIFSNSTKINFDTAATGKVSLQMEMKRL